MKQEITRTKFTCDNCGKTTEELSDFPYSEGWIYLYLVNFKISKNSHQSFSTSPRYREDKSKDKHFCSKECFKIFIDKLLGLRIIKKFDFEEERQKPPLIKKFCLSDKIHYKDLSANNYQKIFFEEDVKEFIRIGKEKIEEIKENHKKVCDRHCDLPFYDITKELEELAGEKLL